MPRVVASGPIGGADPLNWGSGVMANTHANRPAAGTAGRIYFETDTLALFRDTGAVWSLVNAFEGMDDMSSLMSMTNGAASYVASGAWTTANSAHYVRIRVPRDTTPAKLRWFSGSTMAGNYDVGVYADTAGAPGGALWRKGTTAAPATSSLILETITPGALAAGAYVWVAMAWDGTTPTIKGYLLNIVGQVLDLAGTQYVRYQTSAFPLPATAASSTSAVSSGVDAPWLRLGEA